MHWEIHPPRPLRFPSGGDFAPLGPWEISRASGDVFPNTSLLSAVYGYNHTQGCTEYLHMNPECSDIWIVLCVFVGAGTFDCDHFISSFWSILHWYYGCTSHLDSKWTFVYNIWASSSKFSSSTKSLSNGYRQHLNIYTMSSSSFSSSSEKRARSQPRACQRTKGLPASGYYVDLWLS